MPARHRLCGASLAMSCPLKAICPPSGARPPVIRLKTVVLPAPLGPRMPSASPLETSNERSSVTFKAPKLFETFSKERRTVMATSVLAAASSVRDRNGLGFDRDLGRLGVGDNNQVVFPLVALHPLARDERSLANVLHRPLAPVDVADDRVELRCDDGVEKRRLVRRVFGAFHDVGDDFEDRVPETDPAVPFPPRHRLVFLGQLHRRDAGQRRLERRRRSPPELLRQAGSDVPQRFHRRGDRVGFAHRDHLRTEALLVRLGPEILEVRRDRHAADDLDALLLVGGDDGAEVLLKRLEAAGIEDAITQLGKHRRNAQLGVSPSVAVAVVGEEKTNLVVRRHLRPDAGKYFYDVLDAPEVVIGPLEALGRVAAAAEEPRLPGRRGRNARHAVEFALVANRVGVFRRGADDHEIDVVLKDKFARDFRGSVRVRLAVLNDDLDRIAPVRAGDAVLQGLAYELEVEIVGFARRRERPGFRTDVAHLDRTRGSSCRIERHDGRERGRARELHRLTTIQCRPAAVCTLHAYLPANCVLRLGCSSRSGRETSLFSARKAGVARNRNDCKDQITFCRWAPRTPPSSSITSPRFKKSRGFMPTPTPSGVPVTTTSPGKSVMNWLRCETIAATGKIMSIVLLL